MTTIKTMRDSLHRHYREVIANEPIPEHGASSLGISPERRAKILAEAVAQYAGLLAEEQTNIFAAYARSIRLSDSAGPFKFPVSNKLTIEPSGGEHIVKNSISYSVKQSLDVSSRVGEDTPDLFDK